MVDFGKSNNIIEISGKVDKPTLTMDSGIFIFCSFYRSKIRYNANFSSGVLLSRFQSFPSPRLVIIPRSNSSPDLLFINNGGGGNKRIHTFLIIVCTMGNVNNLI